MRHFNLHNGSLALGFMLLVISIAGLYVDTVLSRAPDTPEYPAHIQVIPVEQEWQVLPVPGEEGPGEPAAPLQAAAEPEAPEAAPVDDAPESLEPADEIIPEPEPEEPLPAEDTWTYLPERIIIPGIGIDAPVWPSMDQYVAVGGQVFQQWAAPADYAAGWQPNSAPLGRPGNTVLTGHHNVHGAVFSRLVDLREGDAILLLSNGKVFQYRVANLMILAEEGQEIGVRLENARWLQPSDDERLTLVTCWPQWSNTHRLIIVARPE
jgi:LPXTG-site transpeptidase (sortase) family protein